MKIAVTVNNQDLINRFDSTYARYQDSRIDILRINLGKINEITELTKAINKLRSLTYAKIMLDLPVPYQKYRISILGKEQQDIIQGEVYILWMDQSKCSDGELYIDLDQVDQNIFQLGSKVYFGDGEGQFTVVDIQEDHLKLEAKNSLSAFTGKAIYFGRIRDSYKEKKMIASLKNAVSSVNPEIVALSFVDDMNQIAKFKQEFKSDAMVFSKIENYSGINNLKGIAESSDSIMLGRGDLGICCNIHEIGIIQREVIEEVKRSSSKIYIATDILSSINKRLIPSRADIVDLTTILEAGVDGVVLSAGIDNLDFAIEIIKNLESELKDRI